MVEVEKDDGGLAIGSKGAKLVETALLLYIVHGHLYDVFRIIQRLNEL